MDESGRIIHLRDIDLESMELTTTEKSAACRPAADPSAGSPAHERGIGMATHSTPAQKSPFLDFAAGVRVRGGHHKREGVVVAAIGRGGWVRVLWDGSNRAMAVRPSLLRLVSSERVKDRQRQRDQSREAAGAEADTRQKRYEKPDAGTNRGPAKSPRADDSHSPPNETTVKERLTEEEDVVREEHQHAVKPDEAATRTEKESDEGDKVEDHKEDDIAGRKRRLVHTDQSGRSPTREANEHRAHPQLTRRRRGVIEIGTRVAVFKKSVANRGCGVIVDVLPGGWRRIRLDGEKEPESISFRMHMLELIDSQSSFNNSGDLPPSQATEASPRSRASETVDRYKESHQEGSVVTIVDGVAEHRGKQGVIVAVSPRNGWRKVVLNGTTEERNYRPWQLAIGLKESSSPAPQPKSQPKGSQAENVAVAVGDRVTIIDDTKDEGAIGKPAIVTKLSNKGWRTVRREDTGEVRHYRATQLRYASAYDSAVKDAEPSVPSHASSLQNMPRTVPKVRSPGDKAFVGARVLIVDRFDEKYEEYGVTTELKGRGWRTVAMERGGETRHYRTGQFEEVSAADCDEMQTHAPSPAKTMLPKQLGANPEDMHAAAQSKLEGKPPASTRPGKSTGMQVGDRIRIKDEFLFRLNRESTDEALLGTGIVVEIGTAGQHRVVLESPTDGTTEVCVPRDRLKILDSDIATVETPDIEEPDEPPSYQHITRMSFTPSAKRALLERAAKRSGMQRRICADDELPTCECISRQAWIWQVARKLAERRKLNTGAVQERRSKDEVDEIVSGEENAADATKKGAENRRLKKRRVCVRAEDTAVATDDVKLAFENEDERKFALIAEKEKTIGVECDADCLNRQLFVECADSSCAHGERCMNRQFARQQIKRVRVAKTKRCGWGLFAAEDIHKGDFIIEALGELVDKDEAETRLQRAEALGETNFYMINCDSSGGFVIDATRRGNESRFTNHSCDPSCELNKWRVGDTERYGLFAKRDLRVGEEITFDYRWKQSFGNQTVPERPCYCGAVNCTGVFPTSLHGSNSRSQQCQALGSRAKRRRDKTDGQVRGRQTGSSASEATHRQRGNNIDDHNNEDDEAEPTQVRRRKEGDDASAVVTPSADFAAALAAKARLQSNLEPRDQNGYLVSKAENGSVALETKAANALRKILQEATILRDDDFKDDCVFLEMSSFHTDGPPFLASSFVSSELPPETEQRGQVGGTHGEALSLELDGPRPSVEQLRAEYVAAFSTRNGRVVPRAVDSVRAQHLAEVRKLVLNTKNPRIRKALLDVSLGGSNCKFTADCTQVIKSIGPTTK